MKKKLRRIFCWLCILILAGVLVAVALWRFLLPTPMTKTEIFQGVHYLGAEIENREGTTGRMMAFEIELDAPGVEFFIRPLDPEATEEGAQYVLRWADLEVLRHDLALLVDGALYRPGEWWSATWRLMRMISAWAAYAPATQIAAIYEISGSTVRLYDKEVLKTDLPPPDSDHLRTLLVDEKAVRRGHNYVTIVLNGDTGELLYMAEGKKREDLDRFFEQLNSEQKSKVEAVGIYRSGAYQSSIQAHLPGAAIDS